MRRAAVLVLVTTLAGVGLADDAGVQQIVPLDAGEQQIQVLDVGGREQAVQAVTTDQVADVTAMQPPSAAARAASAAGKVAVGVGAAAFAVGFTVASLMFF